MRKNLKHSKSWLPRLKIDLAIYIMLVSLIGASAILLNGSVYLTPVMFLETLCLLGCTFALNYGRR